MSFTVIIVTRDKVFGDENAQSVVNFYNREFPDCEIIVGSDFEVENAINVNLDPDISVGAGLALCYDKASNEHVIINNGRIIVSPDAVRESMNKDICCLHYPALVNLVEFANEDFLENSCYNLIHDNIWPFLEERESSIPMLCASFKKSAIEGNPFDVKLLNYEAVIFKAVYNRLEEAEKVENLPFRGYCLFDYASNNSSLEDEAILSQCYNGMVYGDSYKGRYIVLPLKKVDIRTMRIVSEGGAKGEWSTRVGRINIEALPGKYSYDFTKARIVFEARTSERFKISLNEGKYTVIPSSGDGWKKYSIPVKKIKENKNDVIRQVNFMAFNHLAVRKLAIVFS